MREQLVSVRWTLWWRLWAVFMVMSTVLRLGLMTQGVLQAPRDELPMAFVRGAMFDALSGAAVLYVLAWFLALLPARAWRDAWWRAWMLMGTALWLAFFAVILVSEWIFWGEFQSRFNFIAVDYLIYTHEVLGNIWQSYPVGRLLAVVGLVSVLGSLALWQRWLPRERMQVSDIGPRWGFPLALTAVLAGGFSLAADASQRWSEDARINALSGAGVYEFFSAVRNSELDYEHFYASVPPREALQRLRQQLVTAHAGLASDDLTDLTRVVQYDQPEQHWNVVLVSIESLSADFLGSFGNTQRLTPHLDELASQGLLFTRLYATGTRTVRGLEALTLSVPPTPGQSIVKRPGHAKLFTLGGVLRDKGYETEYVYGGYGYFDNMNAFFGDNHYEVVDRTAITQPVHHENIWGVADEDLFSLALQRADQASGHGRPFFLHVMTTSNHRPYTYPEGRIDIPSHTGREGAVKYTDWAIGDFIQRAKAQPWFNRTVFVFVADHCASSAGKTELPIEKYHIPAIIYAPGLVKPGRVERLASQIDLAPTLLGLMHMNYTSRFLGYDLMDLEPGRERAFVSTYQNLGYWRGNTLVELSPQQAASLTQVGSDGEAGGNDAARQEALADAISWYQGAAWAYQHGGLAEVESPKLHAGLSNASQP